MPLLRNFYRPKGAALPTTNVGNLYHEDYGLVTFDAAVGAYIPGGGCNRLPTVENRGQFGEVSHEGFGGDGTLVSASDSRGAVYWQQLGLDQENAPVSSRPHILIGNIDGRSVNSVTRPHTEQSDQYWRFDASTNRHWCVVDMYVVEDSGSTYIYLFCNNFDTTENTYGFQIDVATNTGLPHDYLYLGTPRNELLQPKVLPVTGTNDCYIFEHNRSNKAYLSKFDYSASTLTLVYTLPETTPNFSCQAVAMVSNACIYILSKSQDNSTSSMTLYEYNISTGVLSTKSTTMPYLIDPAMVATSNRRLYICGGRRGEAVKAVDDTNLSTAYVYDVDFNTLSKIPSTADTMLGVTATVLPDNRVVVRGSSNNVFVYTPTLR